MSLGSFSEPATTASSSGVGGDNSAVSGTPTASPLADISLMRMFDATPTSSDKRQRYLLSILYAISSCKISPWHLQTLNSACEFDEEQ